MTINIVAAISINKVIGKDNKLPWYYPEDLKRFKEITKGNTILMGRNTFYSIGKPLQDRRNVVLTPNIIEDEGIETYTSINNFYEYGLYEDENVYVIGGESIYRQFLDEVDYLYITLIKKKFQGDTFFPDYEEKFTEIEREDKGEYDFLVYKKM